MARTILIVDDDLEVQHYLTESLEAQGWRVICEKDGDWALKTFQSRDVDAVISQTDYPAWKALVDGRPAILWRANHAFQAVEVPAGQHQIVLVYRDRAFQVGLALCLIAVNTLRHYRGRRTRGPSDDHD